jgi:hypothetical protein
LSIYQRFCPRAIPYEPSYSALLDRPIADPGQQPTMGLFQVVKETMMPSNQEYKGKGIKGRNYDEPSGVGTSSAGKTGTTGNLNDHGRDGGVGTPDMADAGNLQRQAGQPGGTPAQGDSVRGNRQQQQSGQSGGAPGSQQGQQDSGSRQADELRGGQGDRQLGERQTSQDQVGTARPRNDPTPNG